MSDRTWTPEVGMRIQTRADLKNARRHTATILEVREDKSLWIRHEGGRHSRLAEQTWRARWEPAPTDAQQAAPTGETLSLDEALVRRIVREELKGMGEMVRAEVKRVFVGLAEMGQ